MDKLTNELTFFLNGTSLAKLHYEKLREHDLQSRRLNYGVSENFLTFFRLKKVEEASSQKSFVPRFQQLMSDCLKNGEWNWIHPINVIESFLKETDIKHISLWSIPNPSVFALVEMFLVQWFLEKEFPGILDPLEMRILTLDPRNLPQETVSEMIAMWLSSCDTTSIPTSVLLPCSLIPSYRYQESKIFYYRDDAEIIYDSEDHLEVYVHMTPSKVLTVFGN